jgi:hypothetical protein
MLRNLAVIAGVAAILLSAHHRAQAQTIGSSFGSSGGFGAGPAVPLGGIGGAQAPLHLSTDLTAPDLRGTLPVIQTPELTLPADAESATAADGQADPGAQDTPAMTSGSETSLDRKVPQDLGEVNEFSRQAAVAASSGGEQDDDGDDDDNDEGDTPWWVWLLVVVGVAVVVSRLRGGGTRG